MGTGGEIYNIYRIKMNYDEKATFKHLTPYAESTGYFDMMWFMIDKDSPGATVDIHGFPAVSYTHLTLPTTGDV